MNFQKGNPQISRWIKIKFEKRTTIEKQKSFAYSLFATVSISRWILTTNSWVMSLEGSGCVAWFVTL